MNRNYLTTEGQTSDGTMFGYELGYDKTANKADRSFAKGEYNGNISGMLWKSDGDDIRRKYDFTYDGTNRLLLADFEQQNRDDHQWNKSQVNCDVKIGDDSKDPTKAYDANGNILWMQQWGLNVTHSEQIDDLHYSYFNGETSNKLRTVTDNAVGGTLPTATDAGLGDFSDKSSSGNDYGYDANGNMVVDLNKRIKNSTLTPGLDMTNGAIVYNHLNLPATMTVKDANDVDKGTIRYVYDATGNKLQKIVLEKNASGDITTTTTYLDGAVYESKEYANNSLASMNYTDKLLFLGQEEGRVRYIPEENGVAAHYEYDYFIKDHLNNVRMVLTEQSNDHKYMATMEHGANNVVRDQEKQLFDNLDASELLAASVPNGGYPTGNSATNPNEYVARVNGIDHKQGPGIVLKVMSGDVVNIGVQSYYRSKNITPQNGNVLNDILSSLAGGIVAASGVVKGTIGDLSNPSSSPLLGALNTFRNNYNHDMPGKPKAYLNWVLLDEQFKYVDAWPQSGVKPVEGADAVHPLSSGEIDIAKNGYLYIYVSNETENWDVYFDDLAVMHHTGPLLEETHYYPFGLTMAGISSKALTGAVENKCKFNEIEQSTDLGLNQYDAFYRNLDPQIGRFWQIDPKAIDEISPYASMLNNPITHCDPLGDTTTYYDEEGNVLYSTNLKGYRNAFIVNNNSLDAAKQFFGQLGENIGSIGEFLVDAAFSVGNRNGELGDAYDLQSISKFYEQNEAQGEIKSIDRYPIEKMNSITVDGKTVTKEYAKSLKGAEYWANMKKVNGVWTVDFNTVGTVGDMTRSNVSGNDPYIHIHNYTPQLLGKTLRYTVPAAHGFAPGAVGPMVNSLIPSYLDGDVGKAKSEGKIGTVRNMVVNYSHIWFYNGEGIGFKVNRK
jgi:RHS repeat-associated protein